MIKTRLELYNKLKSLNNDKDRRQFLLNCIYSHKQLITDEPDLESQSESESQRQSKSINYLCKLCNSNNFIRDNFSETCQQCGLVRDLPATGKIFEKVKLIEPGNKTLPKELSTNISKWLYDTDPLYKGVIEIKDAIRIIFSSKSIVLNNSLVEITAISLWYNFNYLLKDASLKVFNKKPILALCVYYAGVINKYNIPIEQLSVIFEITLQSIFKNNRIFKEIFKNTNYIEFLNLTEKKKCNIELDSNIQYILNNIKNHIFPTSELTNEQYAAIIYFITNKLIPNKTSYKYKLSELSKECNITQPTISKISKNIETFYKQNPSMRNLLLI